MKNGDMVLFIDGKKKKYGYVLCEYGFGYIVKGIKPNKQYLVDKKDLKRIGGMERWKNIY